MKIQKIYAGVPRLLAVFTVFWLLSGISACTDQQKRDPNKITVRLPGTEMRSLSPIAWETQQPYVQGTILEGLYGYDSEMKVVPVLADSTWHSDDLKRWVFRIHKDRRWSNGATLTAHDFIFAWTRFCSPELTEAAFWASPFPYVLNAPEFRNGVGRPEDLGFRALDDYTIELILRDGRDIRPFLVLGGAMPLYPKVVKDSSIQNWWKPDTFVGNGPYVPVEFIEDERLVLEKNPHYVGKRGNVDRFEIKSGGLTVQLQNYEAGALDLAQIISVGDYVYAKRIGYLKNVLHEEADLGFHGFQIARTVNPLLGNDSTGLFIRRALAMAIDRDRITKGVLANRVLPTYVFGPPSDTMLKGLRPLAYNPDSAKNLLRRAGYNNEVLLMFTPPANDYRGWGPVAEILQTMWKEVGLNVLIENKEDKLLHGYTWTSGFRADPKAKLPGVDDRFTRPGMTMYEGKMLWNDPVMLLRLADHTWEHHDMPFDLKLKLKKLAIESGRFHRLNKGGAFQDWAELERLNKSLKILRDSILAIEPSLAFREYYMNPDFHASVESIISAAERGKFQDSKTKDWLKARNLLHDAEDKYLRYLENSANVPTMRKIQEMARLTPEEAAPYIREVQQEALDKAWIVPLYSEKQVYVARPWLSGITIYKYGPWPCANNLKYVQVNEEAYKKEFVDE